MAQKNKNPWMKNPFEDILRTIPLPLPDPRDVVEGQMPDPKMYGGPKAGGGIKEGEKGHILEFIAPTEDQNVRKPFMPRYRLQNTETEGGMGLTPANAIIPFLQGAAKLAQRGSPNALKLLERYGKDITGTSPFEGLTAQDPSTFVPGEPQKPPMLKDKYKLEDQSREEGIANYQMKKVFRITDQDGNPKGRAEYSLRKMLGDPTVGDRGKGWDVTKPGEGEKPDTIMIDGIYNFQKAQKGDIKSPSERRAYDAPFDPKMVRELLTMVRDEFPDVKYISGLRISGTREHHGTKGWLVRDLEKMLPKADIVPEERVGSLREFKNLSAENRSLKQSRVEQRFKALDKGQDPDAGFLSDAMPGQAFNDALANDPYVQRTQAADKFISERAGPREVNPDNQVEMQLMQRLQGKKFNLHPPRRVMDTVMESFTDGTVDGMLNTNPASGRVSVTFPPMGGGSPVEIPFESRNQALAFIDYLADGQQAPDKEFLNDMANRMHQELGIQPGEAMD